MTDYYPNHVPADAEKFEYMLAVFRNCESLVEMEAAATAFIFDVSYARQDIVVAMGRVERERGWR